ncbi:MAG: hypothetical protein UX48_C0036G0009, partial [Candidatus Azambacteria bacterium GW2011_GWB1_46_27]
SAGNESELFGIMTTTLINTLSVRRGCLLMWWTYGESNPNLIHAMDA